MEIPEYKEDIRYIIEQCKKKERRVKELEETIKNMQTELNRLISRQTEREEEGPEVSANSVMAETTGPKLTITKVNNTSRECRKIKIGFWNVNGLDNKDAQFWEYNKPI